MGKELLHFFYVYLGVGFFLIAPGFLLRIGVDRLGRGVASPVSFFSLIVESFLLSVLITGSFAIVLSASGFGLASVKYFLLAAEILMLSVIRFTDRSTRKPLLGATSMDGVDKLALAVIAGFFFVMVFQGGVLDMLADGWWHMAYAQQMITEGSIFIQQHPLSGAAVSGVLYPPLWHLQLALISDLTAIDLPVVWHFMAALNAALLLSAFFLMTTLLTKKKSIGVVAVILHIFLIGGLISYARVGSWPGNFSYVALYYAFAMVFAISDESKSGKIQQLAQLVRSRNLMLLISALAVSIGLHGVAAALFLLGILAYYLCLGFYQSHPLVPPNDRKIALTILTLLGLMGVIAASTVFKGRYDFLFHSPPAYAPYLSLLIPLGILGFIAAYQILCSSLSNILGSALAKGVYFLVLGFALIWSVDWPHAWELFVPDPEPAGRHVPRDFQDRMGNWLFLPFWEHQLRGGLLWSGILSLLLGLLLPIFRVDRASIFLFSLCSLVAIVIFSPYFFTLGAFVIPLPSVYRVSLLLFSPLIFAVAFDRLLVCRK